MVVARRAEFLKLSQEILGKGSRLRFRALGTSMHPFIRNGEIVEVEPASIADISVGDVVFYRAPWGSLVAHRVIGKFKEASKTALIAKGDAVLHADAHVYPDQVLGRVVAIERGSRRIPLDAAGRRRLAVLLVRFSPLSYWIYWPVNLLKQTLRLILKPLMQKLQNLRAYRKVGRLFVGQRFTVKIATEGDDLSLTQLGLTYDSEIREWFSKVSARSRNFRFLARNGRRVAGMVTLTEFKSGSLQGWWLFGLTVRFRYRGFGIGERLVRKALEEAKRRGATDIRLLVYEEATPAIALYEKLGFYQVHLPELAKQLAEEFKVTGHQRIAMYKEL